MKQIILFFAIVITVQGYGQNWGLGIRLGDPSGITLKKYMKKNALELSVGRSHWFYGGRWYDKRFDDWYQEQTFGYKEFDYLSYHASLPIGIQLHYLFRKDIKKIGDADDISGLEWYFGFGGQLRFQNYYYDYRYKLTGLPDWYYATGKRVSDIDVGGDGVIGLEYKFEGAPVSVFADMTLFMEVVDNPFLFWFQGGIGGRYNF